MGGYVLSFKALSRLDAGKTEGTLYKEIHRGGARGQDEGAVHIDTSTMYPERLRPLPTWVRAKACFVCCPWCRQEALG